MTRRTGEDPASVFIAFLRKLGNHKIATIWLDYCSGKNWWLFTALVHVVNRNPGNLKRIILKYFEPGHTFMSADVEQGMRKPRNLDNFNDFIRIVDDKGISLLINVEDFLHIPRGISQGEYAKSKPKLEGVKVAEFHRGSCQLHWKTSFVQKELFSTDFLQRKNEKWMKAGTNFESRSAARGVNTGKI